MRKVIQNASRRIVSVILVVTVLFTSLPFSTQTASAADSLDDIDAFDAIGIETEVPETVDLASTDNPYGTDRIDVISVNELFEASVSDVDDQQDANLYGHQSKMLTSQEEFYNDQSVPKDSDNPLTPGGYYAYSAASGDFTGTGQNDMVVTVAAGNWDMTSDDPNTQKGAHAGLYLYITNPVTGETSTVKTLLNTSAIIGNIGRYEEENFGEAPYQLQNYLQVATGDFDGDGIDEIVVYIPQGGGATNTSNSRVEVYKLKYTDASTPQNNYLTQGNWEKAWTYYFYEGNYVSNMVSLSTGDFNRDGTDDLAMSWGVYYSSNYKNTSKAAILYGDKSNQMLQQEKPFDLSYGNSQLVRAAFAYADINGDDTQELILGAQSEDDINNGLMNTRVINLYNYNGPLDRFIPYSSDNFSLVDYEDDDGNLQTLGDGKYYSSPAMVANITPVRFGGRGTDYYIYLDSVLYAYGNSGLEIYDMLEDTVDGGISSLYNNTRLDGLENIDDNQREMVRYYVEYGTFAGDFTGDSKENLHVNQYFLNQEFKTSWTEYDEWSEWYNRFWWFRWHPWWGATPVTYTEDHIIDAKLDVLAFYATTDGDGTITGISNKKLYNGDSRLDKYYSLLNTDNDTAYMTYTPSETSHYVVYTDPQVLAVIASAPYFEDVANMEGGDNHVGNSNTSFSATSGSSEGSNTANTISAGAYFGIEADVTVFGVKISNFEMEAEYSRGWTWETEEITYLEQSITYGTAAGEDSVAFYSIPMEVYEYNLFTPITDSNNVVIGYDEQIMTVNIPHKPADTVLSLEKYESIAADYAELPQISGTVLTHEIGDPSTYPSSSNGYLNAEVYPSWASVGYGNGFISQEISMGTETTDSFTNTNAYSFKIGGGMGIVKAGVTVGYERGKGTATTSTEGSTFQATLVNMPAGADDYQYRYSWKLMAYEYTNGITTFPVVSFLVTDVLAPPLVPKDFDWDIEQVTNQTIDLTWSYGGNASAFKIYREYYFSGSTGMVEIAEIPASASEDYDAENNTRLYRYTVEGLNAYQDYNFQVQVVRDSVPTTSATSLMLNTRTKTDSGYPDLALSTKNLLVYPDSVGAINLDVSYEGQDAGVYQNVLYQWQKYVDGQWVNVANTADYTTKTMYIRNAGLSTAGEYRCRVNLIYYDDQRGQEYYITAYSDVATVSYSKRTSQMETIVTSDDITEPFLSVDIHNTHGDSTEPPKGTATFIIEGVDYIKSYDATLVPVSGQKYATASVDSILTLPPGIYEITAYYGGNRYFRSCASEPLMYKAGDTNRYWMELSGNATYGDLISPILYEVTGSGSEAQLGEALEGVSYCVTDMTGTMEMPDWVNGDAITAQAAGTYMITASFSGYEVSKQITVRPYPLTLVAPEYTHTANTSVVEHPSVDTLRLYNSDTDTEIMALPNGDILGAPGLGLYIKATNSGYNEGTILEYDPDAETPPSGSVTYGDFWFYSPATYTLIAAAGSEANESKLSNYDMRYIQGSYTLTAATYEVVPNAFPLLGQVRGTLDVISPADFTQGTEYQNGTQVTFKATPYAGYEVKAWYMGNSQEALETATPYQQVSGTNYKEPHLTYKMKSEPLYMGVLFGVIQNSITFSANNSTYGTVNCDSSPFLTSGAIFSTGTQYTFTAVPEEGYHFVNWAVSGTSNYTNTTMNTITVVGGNTSIILRANFVRDDYVLTLNGDLQAYYDYDHDGDSSTDLVRMVALTGASIPGDVEVFVQPKSGYSVHQWTNVESLEQTYSFIMTEDTTVSADTYYNGYEVSLDILQAPFGNSEVTVSQDITENIVGGTQVVFQAKPVYGTRFVGWKVNGDENILTASTNALVLSANKRTLTINEVGLDYTVQAVFENNEAYTLTLNKAEYGYVTAVVTNNTYGTVDNPTYTYNEDAIIETMTVYKGDVVNFTATTPPGFKVIYWKEDALTTQTDNATWVSQTVLGNKSITVDFSATSFYTVTYTTDGDGTIASSEVDGIHFDSGNESLGAGTLISFIANPGPDSMLDYWMVNGEKLMNQQDQPYIQLDYAFIINKNMTVEAVFTPKLAYSIADSGDPESHASIQVFEVSPMEDAIGDEIDGYTSVRKGAHAKISITPDEGYYVQNVTLTGNGDHFDLLTQDDYVFNTETGEIWVGEVYAIAEDLIVHVETKPIYMISTELSNSSLELAVDNIEPFDHSEVSPYSTSIDPYFVREDAQVNLSIKPNSGYTIDGINVSDITDYTITEGSAGGIWQVSVPQMLNSMTLTVSTSAYTPPRPPSNPPSGGSLPVTPEPIEASEARLTPLVIEQDGKATATVSYEDALEMMDQAQTNENTSIIVTTEISAGTTSASVSLPTSIMNAIARETSVNLLMELGLATINVPQDALDDIVGQASGEAITISAQKMDNNSLSEANAEQVGSNPVYDFTIFSGDNPISSFGGNPVSVTLPYELEEGEDPDKITIYYLADDGTLTKVENATYDAVGGVVVFETDHFSYYMIANEPQAWIMPFVDFTVGDWYYEYIYEISRLGLMKGTTADHFRPLDSTSRAMVVTILYRLAGEPSVTQAGFTDIAIGAYYNNGVSWASQNNIVNGYETQQFGPNDNISREQLATILYRYAKANGVDTLETGDLLVFKDVAEISEYAKDAMSWAVESGLISGKGKGILDPKGHATRAEVAAMIKRLIDYLDE